MRFLRGMLARKVDEPEDAVYELPDGVPDGSPTQTDASDLWDDVDHAAEDAPEDTPDDAEPSISKMIELQAAANEVAQAAAPGPDAVDAAAPVAETVAEPAPDPAPEAAADAAPADRVESVKIWDLFGDDDEAAASDDPVEPVPAWQQPHTGDIPPEPSQNELAREAMQVIQARAFDNPDGPAEAPGPVGRTKTRVLGFAARDAMGADVFAHPKKDAAQSACYFPVGWMVVIDGPGRGASFPLYNGVSQMGRGAGQSIQLNFGDTAISRENHAAIAYDEEQNMFYIGHGGKANIVRLNGRPVLSTEELTNADMIRIGETTLRFVALCGPDFAWDLTEEHEVSLG